MILILLGTIKLQFTRILEQIDDLVYDLKIEDEVVGQTGYTTFQGKNIKSFQFCPQNELDELITKSRLVITHAGTGSIMSALQQQKKLIIFPRYKNLNEHVDDHQLEIARAFHEKEYCEVCWIDSDLKEIYLNAVRDTKARYQSNNVNFLKELKNLIEE